MEEIKAIVQKVIPEGPHGPYVVTATDGEYGSITFSLEPTVWTENEWPEEGMVVVLTKLRKKRNGWRAKQGRFLKLSDEQTSKQERSNEMKDKIQDLIMHNRLNDAIALAKMKGTSTLDEDFITALLYGYQKVKGCDNPDHKTHFSYDLGDKIKLAEVFKFVIPEDVIQKQYAKLLDAPGRHWSGCISETLIYIEKTGVLPKKELVLARYEQEILNSYQSDHEVKDLKILEKVTGIPFGVREEIIQEVFRRVISRGNVSMLKMKEDLLGQKWDPANSPWDVASAVQDGYIYVFCYDHGRTLEIKALHEKTGIEPSQETIDKMYAHALTYLRHAKCCGDLNGLEYVARLTELYKPDKFPDIVFEKIEGLFFYRHPDQRCFFRTNEFKLCFPGLKLEKDSELRLKIEKKCQDMIERIGQPSYQVDDIIDYILKTKECLGFTPPIPPESLANLRKTLEKKEQYKLLEKFNLVFPE